MKIYTLVSFLGKFREILTVCAVKDNCTWKLILKCRGKVYVFFECCFYMSILYYSWNNLSLVTLWNIQIFI